MSDEYKGRQAALIAERVKEADFVITTALIPGSPAPKLVTEAMVKSMKPGSVIVDMAAEAGGNVEGTEAGKEVVKHGVTIIGLTNLPATMPGQRDRDVRQEHADPPQAPDQGRRDQPRLHR